MISKDAIRDELVRAVEYRHITKEDLKWFDELISPTPLDSEVEEMFLEVGDLGLDEVSTDNNIYLVHETKVFKKLENTIRQALQDKDNEIERLRAVMKDEEMQGSTHLPLIPYDKLYAMYFNATDDLEKVRAVATISNENYRKYSNGDKLNTILSILGDEKK